MTIRDDSGEAMAISSDDRAAARDVPQAPTNDEPTPLEDQPVAETPLANSWSMDDDDVADDEEERRIQHWKESPFAVGLVDASRGLIVGSAIH
jgi:hypothetical protein